MTDTDSGSPGATRTTLHRLATHVMARRRFEVSGRFGLRASPGGFATPAFGSGPDVIRLAGATLVYETGDTSSWVAVDGSSLRSLAELVGADIDAAFSCGDDTPSPGDPDAALRLDPTEALQLAEWYALGWRVVDRVVSSAHPRHGAATLQIWPEHFDAATTLGLPGGDSVNLGFSPGDGHEPEPYVYVGPWSPSRPGDAAYWNAPFGAVLRRRDLDSGSDPVHACTSFLERGISLLSL